MSEDVYVTSCPIAYDCVQPWIKNRPNILSIILYKQKRQGSVYTDWLMVTEILKAGNLAYSIIDIHIFYNMSEVETPNINLYFTLMAKLWGHLFGLSWGKL